MASHNLQADDFMASTMFGGMSKDEYYKRKYYKYKAKYFNLKTIQCGGGSNQSKMLPIPELILEEDVVHKNVFLTILKPELFKGEILCHIFNKDDKESILKNGLMSATSYKNKFSEEVSGFRGTSRSPHWGPNYIFLSPKLGDTPQQENEVCIRVDPENTFCYNRKFVNDNREYYSLTRISLKDLLVKIKEFNENTLSYTNENGKVLTYNLLSYRFEYLKKTDIPIYNIKPYQKGWYYNFEVVTPDDIPSIYFIDEAGPYS